MAFGCSFHQEEGQLGDKGLVPACVAFPFASEGYLVVKKSDSSKWPIYNLLEPCAKDHIWDSDGGPSEQKSR